MDPQAGSFSAKIAEFNKIDLDGDVTVPGAFPDGRLVLVSQWAHNSMRADGGGQQPVGVAKLRQGFDGEYADGVYFSTYAAQQTRQLVKEAGPLLEWSYGFSVKRSSTNYRDLAQWPGARQLLQELDVFEVSPAVKGAG